MLFVFRIYICSSHTSTLLVNFLIYCLFSHLLALLSSRPFSISLILVLILVSMMCMLLVSVSSIDHWAICRFCISDLTHLSWCSICWTSPVIYLFFDRSSSRNFSISFLSILSLSCSFLESLICALKSTISRLIVSLYFRSRRIWPNDFLIKASSLRR